MRFPQKQRWVNGVVDWTTGRSCKAIRVGGGMLPGYYDEWVMAVASTI